MGVNLPAAERNDSSMPAAPGALAPESTAQSSQSQDSTSKEPNIDSRFVRFHMLISFFCLLNTIFLIDIRQDS